MKWKPEIGARVYVIKHRYWQGNVGTVIRESNGRQFKGHYGVKLDGSSGSCMWIPSHQLRPVLPMMLEEVEEC